MAERCIPVGSVRLKDHAPETWRQIQFCPVCERELTQWSAPPAQYPWDQAGFTCEHCNLYERGRTCGRIGFEWQKVAKNFWAPDTPILVETRAMHERRAEWAAFSLTSAMEWLVFADWLEEQGFPLNAAGIRENFQSPFEEYK